MASAYLDTLSGATSPGSTSPDLLQASVMALGARAAIDHRDEYEVLPLELIRVWRRHARKLKAADSNGAELKGVTC